MSIAVVILNWNGKHWLEKFLPTVLTYSKEATVYVADNASSDDSVTYVQSHFPTINIIQNSSNGGYAQGYNEALQHLEEDIFCLLNSDVAVTENWLQPILNLFDSTTEIGAIQPKIKAYNQKSYFEYAGAAGGFIDKYGYPFCRGRIFDSLEEDQKQYDDTTEIFWASGACLFVRNAVFKELNGFDTDFFAHMEEIDLCWRIQNAGHKIYYTHETTVYHVGGGTLNNSNPKKTFLNFRNSLFVLLKNLPKEQIKPIVFSRMLLDALAFLKFACSFQFAHAFAILKAHLSYYKLKKSMLAKRNNSPKLRTYYYTSSIVRSYYLNRKKTFFNLIKN